MEPSPTQVDAIVKTLAGPMDPACKRLDFEAAPPSDHRDGTKTDHVMNTEGTIDNKKYTDCGDHGELAIDLDEEDEDKEATVHDKKDGNANHVTTETHCPGKDFVPAPLPDKPACLTKSSVAPISPQQQMQAVKPSGKKDCTETDEEEDRQIKKKEERKAKAKSRATARTAAKKKAKAKASKTKPSVDSSDSEEIATKVTRKSKRGDCAGDHPTSKSTKKAKTKVDTIPETTKDKTKSAKVRSKTTPKEKAVVTKSNRKKNLPKVETEGEGDDVVVSKSRKRRAAASVEDAATASSCVAAPVPAKKGPSTKKNYKTEKKDKTDKKHGRKCGNGGDDPNDPNPNDDDSNDPQKLRKARLSRKSAAYHRAKKHALDQGYSTEQAVQKAKEVTRCFSGQFSFVPGLPPSKLLQVGKPSKATEPKQTTGILFT